MSYDSNNTNNYICYVQRYEDSDATTKKIYNALPFFRHQNRVDLSRFVVHIFYSMVITLLR